jgi:hypothetical protein
MQVLQICVSDTVVIGLVEKALKVIREYVEPVLRIVYKVFRLTINVFSLPPTVSFNSLVSVAAF